MVSIKNIGPCGVHIVVDVQRMFAEVGGWHVPAIPAILPNILALIRAAPGRTLFTRFVVPDNPEEAPGQWKPYYEHWREFTGAVLPPGKVELIEELAVLATPDIIIDKPTYSAFDNPQMSARLKTLQADTLIFSGVETDVCVLATLLAAVDKGFRVIAVEDAMTSSSEAGHRAALDGVLTRFTQQVEIATTSAVLAAWR